MSGQHGLVTIAGILILIRICIAGIVEQESLAVTGKYWHDAKYHIIANRRRINFQKNEGGWTMGIFGCDYLETVGTFLPEYRCKYSRQQLSSRTVTDICMTSRYVDCADYKNASRCFITTAVCLTMGKSDNCEELTVMRAFRDEWLRKQPDGAALVEDYYQTAPVIVEKIDEQPDRKSIYSSIYGDYILPCVKNAKARNFDKSKQIYMNMVNTLKERFVK